MVAANFDNKEIQQSHTTNKELTFQLSFSFRMDTFSWERKQKLKIHRIKLRNWDWGRILKRKFIYVKSISDCHFWNDFPIKMRGCAFNSDRYMIKFPENLYETSSKTWIKKSKYDKGIWYLQIAYM